MGQRRRQSCGWIVTEIVSNSKSIRRGRKYAPNTHNKHIIPLNRNSTVFEHFCESEQATTIAGCALGEDYKGAPCLASNVLETRIIAAGCIRRRIPSPQDHTQKRCLAKSDDVRSPCSASHGGTDRGGTGTSLPPSYACLRRRVGLLDGSRADRKHEYRVKATASSY